DFLPHIFEPFVQAEATLARERAGLGVGLTLVKAIVELHRGSVEARSEGLHLGSEFVVRLPTVGADDAVGSRPSPLQDRPSLGVDGHRSEDCRDLGLLPRQERSSQTRNHGKHSAADPQKDS
ncbi:MAG: ATP-binding protein, partial [Isosphaeraceae bacterium]